jgi:nicotinamide-nucleotide amidase
MVVELISVGTEILMGNIVNTNAAYLSEQCVRLGLSVYHEITVGDNRERLLEVIHTAEKRADILILTGGLGPTMDDLTKETVAEAFGRKLVMDDHSKERIEEYFQRKKDGAVIPENNWKQAEVIEGCMVLDNENGTAPGMIAENDNGVKAILLPGPPNELIPLFEEKVLPYLKTLCKEIIHSKMIKVCGMGESAVEMKLVDLIEEQQNPTIATYAKTGEVHIRVSARAKSKDEAKELMKPVITKIMRRLSGNIYTMDEKETLEEHVVSLLKKYDLSLAAAESLTGGMFCSRIVNVPGASDVLKGGFITYTNKAKRKMIGVKKSTLLKHTAVSKEAAEEMAKGAAAELDADIAVSMTGLAGPQGAEDLPVGTVYIACLAKGKVTVKKYHFNGDRQKIRENAVVAALDLVRKCVISRYA